jgi:hypothetical protein
MLSAAPCPGRFNNFVAAPSSGQSQGQILEPDGNRCRRLARGRRDRHRTERRFTSTNPIILVLPLSDGCGVYPAPSPVIIAHRDCAGVFYTRAALRELRSSLRSSRWAQIRVSDCTSSRFVR